MHADVPLPWDVLDSDGLTTSFLVQGKLNKPMSSSTDRLDAFKSHRVILSSE